jgi:glycine/sarcosine/betaine reductase complex component A
MPEGSLMDIQGKKVIALGERDGIQGAAIAACARSAGADAVLEMTGKSITEKSLRNAR